jgi:hypothetical protein
MMVSETPDRGLPKPFAGEGRFLVDGYRYTNAADAIAPGARTREVPR